MSRSASIWQRFAALPNEHPAKTLLIVFLVALVCAALVSFTAVQLRPLQEQNRRAEREQKLNQMLAALPGLDQLLRDSGADQLQSRLIDMSSGKTVADAAGEFDWRLAIQQAAAGEECLALPTERDPLAIGCRPNRGQVLLLSQGRALNLLVLPIYGRGYQSTLHALLVLHGDLNTIAALQVQEQGETPGLGSRITDPAWLNRFAGLQLRDANRQWRFSVRKQAQDPVFEVDTIAGATRSSGTLGRMIEFWLGAEGYGPLLEQLAKEQGQ